MTRNEFVTLTASRIVAAIWASDSADARLARKDGADKTARDEALILADTLETACVAPWQIVECPSTCTDPRHTACRDYQYAVGLRDGGDA